MAADEQNRELNLLFQQARTGSQRALNQLLQRLRPFIYRKARRFVAARQPGVGPSSLTQETADSLARIITRVRGSGNGTLLALVNKLVRTRGITAFRHGHRMKRNGGQGIPLDAVAPRLADDEANPEERLAQKQRAHRLMVAIAQLPERQRRALEMTLVGHTPGEIAAQLGCGEIAVANLLQRAKHTLRQEHEAEVRAPAEATLLAYLQAESGGLADPARFIREHPEHRQELQAFREWLEEVRRLWGETS